MKNILNYVLILFASIAVSSCSVNQCGGNKDRFLSNFNELVNEITDANLPYSDKNWDKYDKRFRVLVEDCYPEYEDDLSRRERRKFWGQFVKYYYKRYGAGVAREMLGKGSTKLEGIQIQLDDLPLDELNDLFESIGNDVEDWGKELEKWSDQLWENFE
ncbi:MAG: hypothetical protein KDC34_05765 [Saprospiraceae bacterium]|nr:hypothetical protein [Saprospiraceae bacterium]